MRPVHRHYLREFVPAMAAYAATLAISISLLKSGLLGHDALRAAIALLPAVPIAFVLRALLRFVRDSDELERRIELETIAIATAIVAQCYLAAGLLQSARVIDVDAAVAMIWVLPLLCGLYGIVKFFVARRYG
jgi:hypothetical protein